MRDLSARIANRQSVEGPASKIKMTPVKFEEYVRDWISANLEVDSAQVLELSHLGMIEGAGGTYKIDVLVKFSILKGRESSCSSSVSILRAQSSETKCRSYYPNSKMWEHTKESSSPPLAFRLAL